MKASHEFYGDFAKYFYMLSEDPDAIRDKLKFLSYAFTKAKCSVKDVLDVASGGGRFTVPLAKKYNLTGVELNKPFMELAKERAKENKVEINFQQGDMRKLKFSEEFDAAFIMEAFYYNLTNKDALTTLRNLYKSLRSGGVFAFDMPNWKGIIKYGRAGDVWHKEKRGTKVWSVNWFEKNLKTMLWTHNAFVFVEENGKVKTTQDKHVLRMWLPEELRELVKKAGFSHVEIVDFGNFRFSKKPRIGVIAVK